MGRDVRFVLAVMLVLTPLGTLVAQGDPTFDEAMRLYNAKEYRGAASKFGEILEVSPDYYWGWHYVGVCHWMIGELDVAERGLRRALELQPDSFDSHYVLGRVLFERGSYSEAASELERAVAIAAQPDQRQAAEGTLADAWYRAGEYGKARTLLERQVEADGSYRSLYMLGLTCRKLDDLACAVENLRDARDSEGSDAGLPRAVAELSSYRAARSDSSALHDEAVNDALAWTRSAPADREARLNLVASYFRAGRFSDGAATAEDGSTMFPGNCAFPLYAARAHNRNGDSPAALSWADRTIECDPQHPGAYNERARAILDETRALVAAGELLDNRSRIDTLFADVTKTLDRSFALKSTDAAERLQQEAEKVETAYREELARQKAVADEIRAGKNEQRCEELKVKWWNFTQEDGPPLTGEERTFLRETCGEEIR